MSKKSREIRKMEAAKKEEQRKAAEDQLRKVVASRRSSSDKLKEAAEAARLEMEKQDSGIDLEETPVDNDKNKTEDDKKYTFDIKDKNKHNFRISPVEWAMSKLEKLGLYNNKGTDLDLKMISTFCTPFKKEIIAIVGNERCTDSDAKDIISNVLNTMVKIYISGLSDEALSELKISEEKSKKKESIYLRFTNYNMKTIKYNEKVFDEMVSSRDHLIDGFSDIIERILVDTEFDFSKIKMAVDLIYNSKDALSYLQEGLKKRGPRFEHVINNVIQSLGLVKMTLFNPTFMEFRDRLSVSDETLKNVNSMVYKGFKSQILYGLHESCLNLDDKKVRKFFIDHDIIEPNDDEKEEMENKVKDETDIKEKKNKAEKLREKTELTENEKKISEMLEAI